MKKNVAYGVSADGKCKMQKNRAYGVSANGKCEMQKNRAYGVHRDSDKKKNTPNCYHMQINNAYGARNTS